MLPLGFKHSDLLPIQIASSIDRLQLLQILPQEDGALFVYIYIYCWPLFSLQTPVPSPQPQRPCLGGPAQAGQLGWSCLIDPARATPPGRPTAQADANANDQPDAIAKAQAHANATP